MENENQKPEKPRTEGIARFTKGGRRIYDFGQPYVPELDYISQGYKTFGNHTDLNGGLDEHFCQRCVNYYCDLKKSGITKKDFPPKCIGDIAENLSKLLESGKISEEDAEMALMADPITFAAAEFNWKPRWYQLSMLRCSSTKKVVRAGRRLGKCHSTGTKVLTPTGPVEIQNLQIGDTIYGYNPSTDAVFETLVTNVFDNGIQDVVDLQRHNKAVTSCTMSHRWHTITERNFRKVRPTEEIYKSCMITRRLIEIPMGSVSYSRAYAIGALLGDGCSRQGVTNIQISSEDSIIPNAVRANIGAKHVYRQHEKNYTWTIANYQKGTYRHNNIENIDFPLYDEWCRGKYEHEKIIDLNIVKTWDRRSCLELLAGIIDTDGCVQRKCKGGTDLEVAIDTQSPSIRDGVVFLFEALFQKVPSVILDDRDKYVNGPVYSIRVKNNMHCKRILRELDPYLMVERKKWKDEYDALIENNENPDFLGVKVGKIIRQERCWDIEIDTKDHLFLLANGMVSHNSVAMAVKILHLLYTNRNYNILLVCPYQSQVKRVFQIIHNDLLDQAISYNECIVKDHESPPMMIELANGSTITGFSSGAKSGGKSTQIRGQDAHAIFMDEMDYLSAEDFEAVLAILASHPDCILWASSTPTGARDEFFDDCTNKDLGYKEFHFISAESPSWTAETEEHLKEKYSESGYAREFYAEFGDETYGVFRNSDINASIADYTYGSCSYDPKMRYVMGVDWNETHGVHIVINGVGRWNENEVMYKTVCKEVIERQVLTQHKAVERIIALDRIWNCEYIYCDAGFGTVQVEMLHKYGRDNPRTRMHKKVIAYTMQSKISIKDPADGSEIKKAAKPFMVGAAMRQMEMGRCLLPKCEDTNAAIDDEGTQGEAIGLIQQMRAFKIEKYSKYGDPSYSQGYEHTLTAWMLSIVGFVLEMGDMRKVSYDLGVCFAGPLDGRESSPHRSKETVAEETKKIKKKLMPPTRALQKTVFAASSMRRGILNDRRMRKTDLQTRRDDGFIRQPRRIGRKTF